MNTNSIPYLEDALKLNDALLGLPALPLVLLGCIACGYLFKSIPVYPNRWIPAGVFAFGILANLWLGGFKDAGRGVILGLLAGGAAIIVHRKFLKSVIDEKYFTSTGDTEITKKPTDEGGFIEAAVLRWLGIVALAGLLVGLLTGCGTVDRTAFNATKAAVTLVDAGMTAHGAYYRAAWNNPESYHTTTNALMDQRKKLSALAYSVGISAELAETLRRSYRTNAAVKPQLLATLDTLGANASNVVWTVNTILKP